jgi:predicted RecB family nuclease
LARRRDELLALRNIGPAMRRDLALLGVRSVAQLARRDPQQLYRRLERVTGRRQDPCVLDTFAAAVHQARTGEALPWWQFSRERKRRALEARRGSGSSRAAPPAQAAARAGSGRAS